MSLFEILGTVKQHNVVTRDHTNTQHMLSSLKLQTWLSSPFSHQMFVAHTWHQHVTSLSISCTDNPLTSHTLARLHQKDLEHVQQKKKKKKKRPLRVTLVLQASRTGPLRRPQSRVAHLKSLLEL